MNKADELWSFLAYLEERGWISFRVSSKFLQKQVQDWPKVLNKENDHLIPNESPLNEEAPPISNPNYDYHYNTVSSTPNELSESSPNKHNSLSNSTFTDDQSSPLINTPAMNQSNDDDVRIISSFHPLQLSFSPISASFHDASTANLQSESLPSHNQSLSIDQGDNPLDDDCSFIKCIALSSKPAVPADSNNSFNGQQSWVSPMPQKTLSDNESTSKQDVSIIQLSAGESPPLFNTESKNSSLNCQSNASVSSPLNELSLNDITVPASNDSISFGGQVENGKGKGEVTEPPVEVEEVTRVEQKPSVIVLDDDSDDERLEQFFSNLRLESARKERKAKRFVSRKSLAAFIVSDSEEIEEERESEDEKEPLPVSPRILPKAAINTPQTTTSPGCCTPLFRFPSRSHVSSQATPFICRTPTVTDTLSTPSSCLSVKRNRLKMVEELFEMFNRTVFDDKLPPDMGITWNKRMRTTAGWCVYTGLFNRECRIELSQKVCDTYDRIRDTLIHELCHAATWIIDGKRNEKHGKVWQKWAHLANSVHPDLPPITTRHSYEITYKYWYQCSRCDYKFGRHSKSVNLNVATCPYCSSLLELYQ
ncbi:PREDICTED: acidic repeat-containing protein-like isoform X2 [Amphimedon queenslandica]|uniref:SprT-like domain-containing protein n=1 Tax=Amphimedon queenslandica TaxID=400682 RepID=A0AAN0K434_AMPQE|nr:PREDICTED: acidic repeat-containing protein-like isoform X2 [Amphimedon queenslandica]|eukprot:XP_019864303.1 PREDICTED: acidic repeat-containing protein-like isoform X2 [Amphimedon queenslandica]